MNKWLVCSSVLAACTAPATDVVLDQPMEAETAAESGDVVHFRGVSLEVPDDVDDGVAVIGEGEDGDVFLQVTNRGNGFVDVIARGELELSTRVAPDAPAAATGCTDSAYALASSKWGGALTWNWYLSTAGNPSADMENAIKRGAANIESSRNDCGLADEVPVIATYRGRVGSTNVPTTSCATRDGINLVGFGALSGFEAYTCWYFSGTRTTEADIRFRSGRPWITTPGVPEGCTTALHLESVATHEIGHVFGLLHPSGSHPTLTMQAGGPCDASKATLGRGDVLGLRALY